MKYRTKSALEYEAIQLSPLLLSEILIFAGQFANVWGISYTSIGDEKKIRLSYNMENQPSQFTEALIGSWLIFDGYGFVTESAEGFAHRFERA